jgi:hypothetical protein
MYGASVAGDQLFAASRAVTMSVKGFAGWTVLGANTEK